LTSNISIENTQIKYSTENQYNINRFGKLLSNLGYINYKIEIQGKIFNITCDKIDLSEITYDNDIYIYNIEWIYKKDQLEKSLVRGSFMGSGSINNPKNKYHLEILLKNVKNIEYILNILEKYNIHFKILENKN